MSRMTPAYNRPRKNWGLRRAYKPQEGFHLSGVAKCSDRAGRGYIYIAFDEPLVDAVVAVDDITFIVVLDNDQRSGFVPRAFPTVPALQCSQPARPPFLAEYVAGVRC